MNFFIAVVFFCTGPDCYFWKAEQNYYSVEDCQQEVMKFMDYLETEKVQGMGQCLKISTRNNI